jgi:hypothetical protein
MDGSQVNAIRRTYARGAGIAVLVSVLSVLILHLGPGLIAGGARATGTSNLANIAAYYSHPSMLPYWWQGGISLIGLILFAVLFRRYLLTFSLSPLTSGLVDLATAATVAVTPLYAMSAGMESAMVQLVSAGEAGRGALLGVFSSWDWIYNSFAYFFEAGYMGAWAIVGWRSGALPRWIAVVGGATAVGHVFNSQVLMSHLSDNLTLLPTAFFFIWLVSAGIYLVRGGNPVIDARTREPELSSFGPSNPSTGTGI